MLSQSCASISYITRPRTQTTGSAPETQSGVSCTSTSTLRYFVFQADRHLAVSIEFSLSIIVACLPALAPLLKRLSVFGSVIPSSIRNRSKNTSKSSQKTSAPHEEIELGNRKRSPHSSWEAPKAWKEPHRKQSFDTRASYGSEMALQPMQPTHGELNHKD